MGLGGLTLQWGRNFIVAEMTEMGLARGGFWVASMGPQLYRCGNRDAIVDRAFGALELQWGRNFIVAEIRDYVELVLLRVGASMGPQLYRCGNLPKRHGGHTSHTCFNGAATLSLRKCVDVPVMAITHQCFNGAATLSLRKSEREAEYRELPCTLQWGRNFIVAEIRKIDLLMLDPP